MKFIVKTNNADILKKYGFMLPEEWLASGAFDGTSASDGYMIEDCFYMFKMDEEYPSKIAVEEDFAYPLLQGWIDTRYGKNTLWFDAIPWGTFHSGMDDLLPMMDVIYQLTIDGLLERDEEE